MEQGVVVPGDQVWVNRLSRVIPMDESTDKFKIGSFVHVWLTDAENEITNMEEIPSNGLVTANDKELKIVVRLIFPPRVVFSKIGLKLYSTSIGLISVNESWRSLFDKAADMNPVVYEATSQWCQSSREFVLADNQTLLPMGDDSVTYLTVLKESPWMESIQPPNGALDILHSVIDKMVPFSSNGDTGILMGRKGADQWNVYVLDKDENGDQWKTLSGRMMDRHSGTACRGATVRINTKDEWRVVDHDESVVPKIQSDGTVMLDVAARAEKIEMMGTKSVTRLLNNRVMHVFDYNGMLGSVEIGEVVRVLIKWTRMEGDRFEDRYVWVVDEYGTGDAVLPESQHPTKRSKEMKQALNEFRLVEYASARDWMDNELLMNYKEMLHSSMEEECRREEERQRRTETQRKEEEEFIRHKQQLDEVEEREEMNNSKMEEISEEEDRESYIDATPLQESSANSTHEEDSEDANSTRSSNATQITVIPANLPAVEHDLNRSGHSLDRSGTFSNPSTGSYSSLSRDSGIGTGSDESDTSVRERRILAVMRRLEGVLARNEILRSLINLADPDWMDDLSFVLNEY